MNLTLSQIKVRQMYQAINVKSSPTDPFLDHFYKYVMDLVISEPFPNVLAEILKLSLDNPFPTVGINKIEDKYGEELAKGNLISANFDSYWSSITGVINRVIKGRISGYLQGAR
ncbi:YxiJ family protein, partial [Priestia megaterium]|uniref:YxiJ family protein n=1 Tax=Priestia megaterium TaxID=1404 RepID=UPI002E1F1297|nr:YxiJ family protein [Priestia megaterium]